MEIPSLSDNFTWKVEFLTIQVSTGCSHMKYSTYAEFTIQHIQPAQCHASCMAIIIIVTRYEQCKIAAAPQLNCYIHILVYMVDLLV